MTDPRSGQAVRTLGIAASIIVVVAMSALTLACGSEAEDETVDPLSQGNAEVSAGAQAVKKRRCVNCHTASMAGNTTPVSQTGSVELYAPNLTNDMETGVGSWTDDQLALAIRTGVDNESQQLCPQMTHFAEMSDYEVFSIVKYLRSIPAVRNPVPRSVCPPLKTKDEQR